MSSHDRFRHDLPAYAARRLKGEDLRLFEEHLEECDDCERLASAWSDMAAVVRGDGEALFEPHPSPAELRVFAVEGAGAVSDRILRHVEVCASCELEALMWHQRDGVAESSRAPARRLPVFAVASLSVAAGLLLGLGIAIAWRSLDGSAGTTTFEPSAWAGPTQPILLPRPLRGEAPPVLSHHLEKAEQRVVIAFPLVESHFQEDDGLYRFEISSSASGPVFTQLFNGQAIRRHLQAASVVTFDIPADRLRPDRYECRVLGPDGAVLYRTSLEIIAAD